MKPPPESPEKLPEPKTIEDPGPVAHYLGMTVVGLLFAGAFVVLVLGVCHAFDVRLW